MQEKYGFVYIWRDRKHKRYYIGSHWGYENDGYICSSTWMNNSYKRRPQDFKRRIISKIYTNRSELLDEENAWLKLIDSSELGIRYYNLRNKDFGHWATAQDLSLTIKEKISIKTKEAMAKPAVRAKFEKGLKYRNNIQSKETKAKRSKSMKKTMAIKFPIENRNFKLTEEQRKEYYSNKAKDMHAKRTDEERIKIGNKISKANIGKQFRLGNKNSEDHNRKIIESNINRGLNRRMARLELHKTSILNTLNMSAVDAAAVVGVGRQLVSAMRSQLLNGHGYL